MVNTRRQQQQRMDPEIVRFMEHSEQLWKETAELLSSLGLKYGRLFKNVQRLQTESSEGRFNSEPPPPPPPRGSEQPNSSNSNNTNNQRRTDNPINTRMLRLDFPRFEGDELLGWLYQTEQFFEYHQTPLAQHLRIASFHLEGEALQWYQWTMVSKPLSNWSDFAKALVACFGPTEYEDYVESLAKLQQTDSLQEF